MKEHTDIANTDFIVVESTDNLFNDTCQIIDKARGVAYQVANMVLVQRNWLLGQRIANEELKGEDRAKYGKQIIERLALQLTNQYGKGFDFSALYKYLKFYRMFPDILDSVSTKSRFILSWTHFNGSEQLFAAKYLTYLPTKEELRREIEQQK